MGSLLRGMGSMMPSIKYQICASEDEHLGSLLTLDDDGKLNHDGIHVKLASIGIS